MIDPIITAFPPTVAHRDGIVLKRTVRTVWPPVVRASTDSSGSVGHEDLGADGVDHPAFPLVATVTFVELYNHHRPHRSLPRRATPAATYLARPNAAPRLATIDPHHRVRHDRVDKAGIVSLRYNGRLHHIGVGRTYSRTPGILLVADLDIRVIHATTGEILRALTLDPTRDYQPTGRPPSPARKAKRPEPQ